MIHLVNDRVDCINTVKTDTALKAGSGFLSQYPQQFNLLYQILHALVNVCEAADGLSGQMGFSSGKILVLVLAGKRVCHGGGPDMGRSGRVSGYILYSLAHIVDDGTQAL